MMRSIRDISIYCMAVLVFLGSTGLMVDHHYCQGQLEHSALMTKAASCHQKKSCHQSTTMSDHGCCEQEGAQDEDRGCCSNESEFVQVDLDIPCFDASHESILIFQHALSAALPAFTEGKVGIGAQYINYIPPPRLIDPHSLFQVFRC